MLEPKYKRILLKLSGEAISGSDGIIDFDFLDRIAATLVEISAAGVETAVIFGAGNIWRGRQGGEMNRVTADRMGMLATVINSLAAKDAVERAGGKAEVYTSTDMMPYAEYYTADRAIESLSEGKVVIFGGGTGCPYFSTDTAGMLRAIEIGADAFLLAKNVDGIYDRDPKEGNAKLFDEIGYMDMVKLGLRGIDLTASAMGAEFGPPAVAFRLADVEDIKRAVEGKGRGTVIVRN
ncbi:MAG: uridine monophosphate kinase [Eubacteriales bacterium]|nr:uridine monophosphate kinase [Clostridiales bacterium]MDD7593975.1 uridine monophosphate kinase [Clostridiales bacterium]MDY5860691.1 uridine monophosphate kinase [Eubacteriales bacterium]